MTSDNNENTESLSDVRPGSRGRRRDGKGPRGNKGKVQAQNRGEKLYVESGFFVLLDQFMLGNGQLLEALKKVDFDSLENDKGLTEALLRYGGLVVKLEEGSYRVFRNAFSSVMAVYPAELKEEDVSSALKGKSKTEELGRIFIDARCLVFIDAAMLGDSDAVSEYQKLRQKGLDKKARDLIRKSGGAVRYGFNREGDELIVARFPDSGIIGLWPV